MVSDAGHGYCLHAGAKARTAGNEANFQEGEVAEAGVEIVFNLSEGDIS